MEATEKNSPLIAFAGITDPRSWRNQDHSLSDIIFLTIAAVVSGANAWTEIENFGHQKLAWLRKFGSFRNGIPSHDTLGRVFAAMNPDELERAFERWVADLARIVGGEVVSIDGKTLRGSYDRYSGKAAIHMVSAWAGSNRIVLGQNKTEAKSNEITAIPALLVLLALKGSIVTIDAMGCQKDIVAQIRKQEADYMITVKENQPSLFEQIERSFNCLKPSSVDEQTDAGHGRVETRKCELINDLKWIECKDDWKDLASVVRLTRTRYVKLDDTTSVETRYYIASSKQDAKTLNKVAKAHWAIENNLHWVLDVVFSEDAARNRVGYSDQNFSIIRRIALNMIKKETDSKGSINIKRQRSALNDDYREIVLGV